VKTTHANFIVNICYRAKSIILCTNLAEHFENLDHNSVYRYLKTEKLTPRLLWEKVKD